jgi:hypothetical protein
MDLQKSKKSLYKDKAVDYEMENILAKLQTDDFNEDEYYHLKYERFYQQL